MAISLQKTSTATRQRKLEGAEKAGTLIVPVSKADSYLKMVVYGRNGVGKTTFAGSSNLKTLLVDCNEKGWIALRNRPNVEVYPLEIWDQLDWVYWFLRAKHHEYEVVAIDTITMLAAIGMKWILSDEASRDFSKDPQMPDKRHWGKLGEVVKTAIINFRNLPMHVLFLAQEKVSTVEDDEGGTLSQVHPELSPAPRSVLLSSVSITGRLFTREVEVKGKDDSVKKMMERRMLLGPHAKFESKNRFDELRYIERNPTLQKFLDRIAGGSNASSSENPSEDNG